MVAVLLAACVLALPLLGSPYHIDEPLFLAIARGVLADPLHPTSFVFNWHGSSVPLSSYNNGPLTLAYMLAVGLKLTGGGELAMRLLYLPIDLLSAALLYLIASRFLRRPLWPVLAVVAAPAFLPNIDHLMGEKFIGAFGFFGLYALLRSDEDGSWGWLAASAGALGGAMVTKYGAALFVPPAVAVCLERRMPWKRMASYLALMAAPVVVHLAVDHWMGGSVARAAVSVLQGFSGAWWSGWNHRTRAFLSMSGGGALVLAVWPWWVERRAGILRLGAAFACAGALFLPVFDLAPVRPIDRVCGIVFAAGALASLLRLGSKAARAERGWSLWTVWTLSAGIFSYLVYWGVLTRLVLFVLPPLVFSEAAAMEADPDRRGCSRLQSTVVALSVALTLALGIVDAHYCRAQKRFSEEVAAPFVRAGRKVWFSGHWGFQFYMERAGAEALDLEHGGWAQARPGDVVVVPHVNTMVLRPSAPVRADVRSYRIEEGIPLRLISGWSGEGGYYFDGWGFLPYSFSREPLEEFSVVLLR